jgi:hypothetical protein
MRNRPLGLVGALMLTWTMATAGCGSSSSGGGAGGAGGSAGSGGAGGSSGNGGAGGGVTTLSGSKAVNALTAAEATQLCNDTYAYFGTAIPKATTCKWKGLAYGASSSAPSQDVLQQKCTMQESSCTQGGDPWANNPGCNDIPTTCTATVAAYSACISAEAAAFVQAVNALPVCTALMTSDVSRIMDAETGGTPPASCASLMNACADLTPPSPLNQ